MKTSKEAGEMRIFTGLTVVAGIALQPRRCLRLVGLAAVAVVAAAAGSGATEAFGSPAGTAPAHRNGRIVYADPGTRGRWSMFTVDVRGRGRMLLTRDGGIWPEWSPDGTKLLFTRGDRVFMLGAGRGAVPRLLLGGANRSGAHWSPDGRRIVFETTRGIEVANADGSGRRLLVRDESARFFFGDPDWSPDGREIVLTRATWSPLTWPWVPEQIYVMRSNGTGLRALTEDVAAADRVPRWSPDGTSILFARCPAPWTAQRTAPQLVVLKHDGSERTTIPIPGPDCVRIARWSPDGREILYLDERTGVELVNADGSVRRHLLSWADGVYGFSWQALR
ncbi:MAG TPA: hypothetical protein VH816_01375 [Gaiellaceae bacterium]